MTEIDYEKVVSNYIALRDAIEDSEKKFKESIAQKKELLKQIETILSGDLESKGLSSYSTSMGTVYKEKWTKVNSTNWDDFFSYVLKNKRYDLIEKRVAKLATLDTIEQEGQIPGVEVQSGYSVKIRRK